MPVTFESETDTAELRRSPEPEEQPITKTNGQSSPLGGGTVSADGVNFSVFSRNATSIELLSVERVDGAKPARVIRIDPVSNRTYHDWHVFVPGARAGQIYAYRIHGPFDPAKGLRFEPKKLLLDPYGRGVVVPDRGGNPWRRSIDTGLESPLDIAEWQTAPAISGRKYRVEARSVVMLFRTLDA
jgi:pullulanase/glycogen debranching enzyme